MKQVEHDHLRGAPPFAIFEGWGLRAADLDCGDSVEARSCREASGFRERVEGSVGVDRENADSACAGIESVEELAVGSDGDVQIGAAGGKRRDDGCRDRRQRSVSRDGEPRDRACSWIRGVDVVSVGCNYMPASSCGQSGNTCADHGESFVGQHSVGRERGSVVSASRSGLGGDRCAAGREQHAEQTRTGTGIRHDRCERAIGLNVKSVDGVGEFFGDQKSLAIGAER